MQRPPGGDDREGHEISVAAPQQISISEGEITPSHTSVMRDQNRLQMASAEVCSGSLADCSREEAKRLLCQANMKPPLLAKPLWADGREGAHGLAVIHEVRPISMLVFHLWEH